MNFVSHEFGVLQARVEAEVSRPAVIAITSATRRDGKTMLSTGLAQSLAASSYRVLLVDGNQQKTTATPVRRVPGLTMQPDFDIFAYVTQGAVREPDLLELNPGDVENSFTNEAARWAFARCRERYDYVIVDTSGALQSSAGLTFAAIADAVIVTVRLGRASRPADRDLVTTLRSVGANLIGVVTTRRAAISAFAAKHRHVVRAKAPHRGAVNHEEPVANRAAVGVRIGTSK